MRYFLSLFLWLAPLLAFAATDYQQPITTGIAAVPLNSLPAALTTRNMEVAGFNKLTLQINFTFSSATSIGISCAGSLDGVNFGSIQAVDLISGTGTLNDYSYTKQVSGNTNFVINLGVNYKSFRCTFSGAGAGAGDLITVLAFGQAQAQ